MADIQQALLTGFCSMLVATLVAMISYLVNPICSLLGFIVEVDELRRVRQIDGLLVRRGWCSSYTLNPRPRPSLGPHFMLLHRFCDHTVPGVLFLYKGIGGDNYHTYSTYKLVAFQLPFLGRGDVLGRISDALDGKSDHVLVRRIEKPTTYGCQTSTVYIKPPGGIYDWQERAVDQIWSAYQKENKASALLYGPQRTGKSALGKYLAVKMKTFGLQPIVVYNASLTTPGAHTRMYVGHPEEDQPVILVLNEYDSAVDHAEDGEEKGDRATSMARNRAHLHDTMDAFNDIEHLVVIATTNKDLSYFDGGADDPNRSAYIREGRLSIKIRTPSGPPFPAKDL